MISGDDRFVVADLRRIDYKNDLNLPSKSGWIELNDIVAMIAMTTRIPELITAISCDELIKGIRGMTVIRFIFQFDVVVLV